MEYTTLNLKLLQEINFELPGSDEGLDSSVCPKENFEKVNDDTDIVIREISEGILHKLKDVISPDVHLNFYNNLQFLLKSKVHLWMVEEVGQRELIKNSMIENIASRFRRLCEEQGLMSLNNNSNKRSRVEYEKGDDENELESPHALTINPKNLHHHELSDTNKIDSKSSKPIDQEKEVEKLNKEINIIFESLRPNLEEKEQDYSLFLKTFIRIFKQFLIEHSRDMGEGDREKFLKDILTLCLVKMNTFSTSILESLNHGATEELKILKKKFRSSWSNYSDPHPPRPTLASFLVLLQPESLVKPQSFQLIEKITRLGKQLENLNDKTKTLLSSPLYLQEYSEGIYEIFGETINDEEKLMFLLRNFKTPAYLKKSDFKDNFNLHFQNNSNTNLLEKYKDLLTGLSKRILNANLSKKRTLKNSISRLDKTIEDHHNFLTNNVDSNDAELDDNAEFYESTNDENPDDKWK